jgi:hypothetical protein
MVTVLYLYNLYQRIQLRPPTPRSLCHHIPEISPSPELSFNFPPCLNRPLPKYIPSGHPPTGPPTITGFRHVSCYKRRPCGPGIFLHKAGLAARRPPRPLIGTVCVSGLDLEAPIRGRGR